jgi:hypothetical protein
MAAHFSPMITHFPILDRLYVQFVPRNDILNNPDKVAHITMADLWMERNNCYSLLMRELFSYPPRANFAALRIFESGDAADADAWMLASEFISRPNNGWQITGDGVVERDPESLNRESSSSSSSSSEDDEEEDEGFQAQVKTVLIARAMLIKL